MLSLNNPTWGLSVGVRGSTSILDIGLPGGVWAPRARAPPPGAGGGGAVGPRWGVGSLSLAVPGDQGKGVFSSMGTGGGGDTRGLCSGCLHRSCWRGGGGGGCSLGLLESPLEVANARAFLSAFVAASTAAALAWACVAPEVSLSFTSLCVSASATAKIVVSRRAPGF